jgi:hypothetical protein
MADIRKKDLPKNLPEKVTQSYEKAKPSTNILEKGKEVLEKGKEKVKEIFTPKEGDLPSSLPQKVKESYRKANLDMSKATLLDKGKGTLEKGKETLEKGKEKVKEMFKPEMDLPRNIPERVRESHLQYSTQWVQDQPTLIDKGKETFEKGKEKIKEIFRREDENIPSDVPERVKESHREYEASVPDTENFFQVIEDTFEKGKEKVISLFRGEQNLPEFGPNTPQLVRDSYDSYEERLRDEEPTILDKGRDLIKEIFSPKDSPRVHLELPMYVPDRVMQSHMRYEEGLRENQTLLEKGRELVKEVFGI